jgi:hypothetical protein
VAKRRARREQAEVESWAWDETHAVGLGVVVPGSIGAALSKSGEQNIPCPTRQSKYLCDSEK